MNSTRRSNQSFKTQLIPFVIALLAISACTKRTETGAPAGNAAPTGDTIRIGEVGSMTGSEATFGTSTHQGIQLAVEQLNASGGVKGKKIEIVTLDNQSKNDETAMVMTRLVNQEKVTAVLGEVASTRSLVMAPIAQKNQIVMVSPSSTNPKVTDVGEYVFRVCFIDPFQGYVMAKFAAENLKAKKVAILRDVKSDYSIGLADYFIETFKKMGGEIVADLSYSSGDMDFKAQLTAIKGKTPDAIFLPGYYNDVGTIARQARRDLKITAPFLGGDGWDSPKLIELAGDSLNGSFFSNHYSAEDQSPQVQQFISQYKTKFGAVPDGLAAMGYDAAKALADAMSRAKSLSSADIREAMAATKDFAGVTGKITIDAKRNAVKSAVVLKVDGKDYKYVSTVTP